MSGECTRLREFLQARRQAYVLRVPRSFPVTLADGTKLTCADAVKRLANDNRRWEVRSAGTGSMGQRWYAWAWIGTASPRHYLLVRRHLTTGEPAAAQLRDRTDTQTPLPAAPGQAPSPDPGTTPLTVPEIRHLLAAAVRGRHPPGHAARWLNWRRRHQARYRWYHQHARLSRNYALVS